MLLGFMLVITALVCIALSPPAQATPNDFNLDNKSDLVLSNANGLVDLWLMNGTTVVSRTNLLNTPGWAISHLADFNGDGKTDILWRNVNGAVTLWLMDGANILSAVGLIGADG
jgi:FG-GAP-like repeat